ncbi:MAG: transposase [Streptosporangiaceae bacterium]|nr:transposase [Streptosporangiaceae bacterium]
MPNAARSTNTRYRSSVTSTRRRRTRRRARRQRRALPPKARGARTSPHGAQIIDGGEPERDRSRSEAAFAALGGTSPIPASSGTTVRHRLNCGRDRALNRAIHAIALVRMRSCLRTRAYAARRTAAGKTTREIRRCLKHHIARELYRQLSQSMKPPTNP